MGTHFQQISRFKSIWFYVVLFIPTSNRLVFHTELSPIDLDISASETHFCRHYSRRFLGCSDQLSPLQLDGSSLKWRDLWVQEGYQDRWFGIASTIDFVHRYSVKLLAIINTPP